MNSMRKITLTYQQIFDAVNGPLGMLAGALLPANVASDLTQVISRLEESAKMVKAGTTAILKRVPEGAQVQMVSELPQDLREEWDTFMEGCTEVEIPAVRISSFGSAAMVTPGVLLLLKKASILLD